MSNTRKTAGTKATAKKAAPAKKATTEEAPAKADLDTLLAEDSRPETTVPICLRGHLQAEWDQLKAQYDAGPGEDDKALMAERAAKRRIAEQMAQIEAEMRAGTVQFRLRAVPRRRTADMPKGQPTWHELIEQHPPRRDDKGKVDQRDAGVQVNVSTFFDALVRASVIEPQLTEDQWSALDAKLNDAQFQKLAWAAWRLNREEVDVPFSRAASMMRTSGTESRRQNDSASPSAASTAGNRSRSRSTNTTTKGA